MDVRPAVSARPSRTGFDRSLAVRPRLRSRDGDTITRRRAASRRRCTHLETLELAVPRSVVHHALKIHFHIVRSASRRTGSLAGHLFVARGACTFYSVSSSPSSSTSSSSWSWFQPQTDERSRSGASSAPTERRGEENISEIALPPRDGFSRDLEERKRRDNCARGDSCAYVCTRWDPRPGRELRSSSDPSSLSFARQVATPVHPDRRFVND